MAYFFDAYALVEILFGNPNYQHYAEQTIYTSGLCLSETYYALFRIEKKPSRHRMESMPVQLIEATKADWLDAAEYRLARKNERISFSDSLGYVLAKKNHMEFLTGDSKFEYEPNVEYVK